jgi:pimeloyl-ACP methyl ester carboxylesterase
MEHVDVNGLRIGYERAGAGPVILLLHGYVADGPTTWRPQIEDLSDDFTLVAWDAPGAGSSTDPPEDLGMAGYADCLAGFVTLVISRSVHVVGLSFGGALALELCRRHPELVSRLVLVSAYAGWRGSLGAREAERRLSQADVLADARPDEVVEILLPTMFAARTSPETVAAFGASLRELHPRGFRAMARASAEDLRDALPAVRVPTLLIHGDRDVRAPRAVAEELHRSIRGSRLVVVEGAGHLCNLEAPEEFNRVVRSFLRAS